VPRYFMFVDDNIIADPEYARELFRAMVPMRKRWISQCSLKIADDPELLCLARAASRLRNGDFGLRIEEGTSCGSSCLLIPQSAFHNPQCGRPKPAAA
jgi:hypothetical protein